MNWLRTLCDTLLLAPGSFLSAPGGLDFRIRLLALLLVATVAFVAIAPDLDLEPGRLVHSLLNLVSVARLANTALTQQAVNVMVMPAEISRSDAQACIIELTCSRLC